MNQAKVQQIRASKKIANAFPTIYRREGSYIRCVKCEGLMHATKGRAHSCLHQYLTQKARNQTRVPARQTHSDGIEDICLSGKATNGPKQPQKHANAQKGQGGIVVENIAGRAKSAPIRANPAPAIVDEDIAPAKKQAARKQGAIQEETIGAPKKKPKPQPEPAIDDEDGADLDDDTADEDLGDIVVEDEDEGASEEAIEEEGVGEEGMAEDAPATVPDNMKVRQPSDLGFYLRHQGFTVKRTYWEPASGQKVIIAEIRAGSIVKRPEQ